MTLETLVSLGHEFDAPRFSVRVGSRTFEETSGLVSEVSVDRTIAGADRFSLAIATRFDYERGDFVDFDWEQFAVDESVEIAVGYAGTLTRVFTGSITEHETDFPAGGPPSITVGGYGRYHELTRDVVREHWEATADEAGTTDDGGITDADIATKIAIAYDFVPVVDSTPIEREVVENEYESDAVFLEHKLAPRNADETGLFEVFTRLDELVFRAPQDNWAPGLELTYGESLQSFSPTLTEAETPERVDVPYWDHRPRSAVVSVETSDGGTGRRVVRRPVRSRAKAERIARATAHRAEHDRLRATGSTIGLPELEIGEPIALSGLGEQFSGTYYVEGVTHTIGGDGYTTDFTVRETAGGVVS